MNISAKAIITVAFSILLSSCGTTAVEPTETPTSIPDTPTRTSTPTVIPTETPTPTPSSTPIPTATPFGGSEIALLGLQVCEEHMHPLLPCKGGGTLGYNLRSGKAELMGDGKYNVEDISPDGKSLLLSAESNLYVTDMEANEPLQVGNNFARSYGISAFWMQSSQIAFIGKEGSQKYIYLVNPDGSDLRSITDYGMKPYLLVPSNNSDGVLWQEAVEHPIKGPGTLGWYWTSVSDDISIELPISHQVTPSPSGERFVYEELMRVKDEFGRGSFRSRLMLLDLQTMESREIPLPYLSDLSQITNLMWVPDGRHLIVGRNICRPTGATSWTCDKHRAVIIDLNGNEVEELPEELGYMSYPWHWSIDGKRLFQIFSFPKERDNFVIGLQFFDYENHSYKGQWFEYEGDIDGNIDGQIIWVPSNTYPSLALSSPEPEKLEPHIFVFADESLKPSVDDFYISRIRFASNDKAWIQLRSATILLNLFCT